MFYTPIDNYATTVAVARPAGSPTLTVVSAAGLGSPTSLTPIRLTVVRASDSARLNLSVTGVMGNLLTVAPIDGFADLALAVGDAVGCVVAAATIAELQTAISAFAGSQVVSVAGRTGAVVLEESDIAGLTSDLTARAPLASPAFTGTPTAPTVASSDSSTKVATTAYVRSQNYLTSAPVTSVAGRTGAIVLSTTDVSGLGSIATHAATDYLTPAGNGSGLTGLLGSQIAGNIAGNAAGLTSTLAIAQGGTGQTSASAALNGLLPSQASQSGKVLGTNGTIAGWVTAASGGGSLSIGSTVTGGTAGSILYLDSGGNLADSGIGFASKSLTVAGTYASLNIQVDAVNDYVNVSSLRPDGSGGDIRVGAYLANGNPDGACFQAFGNNSTAGFPGQIYFDSGTASGNALYFRTNANTLRLAIRDNAPVTVYGQNTGYPCLVVEGATGQSGDLLQWQNSSGTPLSGVDPNGLVRTATTSGAPTSTPAVGSMAFDSAANKLWICGNSGWKSIQLT